VSGPAPTPTRAAAGSGPLRSPAPPAVPRPGRLGRVVFVGAGPGDPDLITVKGLALVRAADVIVHDRLVAAELLSEARPDAEIVDAGKAPGRPGRPQAAIEALLVDRARRGRLVVRLKGGDPAVFGRLAEEIRAVERAGLPFEVVPGVTAACAAAAAAGVSLTERGIASTVVLATGTHPGGAGVPALDWPRLARVDGTLVFYMAVRALAAITATLVASGRDPVEPAIVVERATTAAGRVLAGRLATIAALAGRAGVESPAVLITGPAVGAAAERFAVSATPAGAGALAGRPVPAALAGVGAPAAPTGDA
jgi:uroporphyrin-III C-methyltransferase